MNAIDDSTSKTASLLDKINQILNSKQVACSTQDRLSREPNVITSRIKQIQEDTEISNECIETILSSLKQKKHYITMAIYNMSEKNY